ncbi:hypothetical protein ABGB12_12640 [Actinocorallia sp. B10E7]|uniref:hypothetical protein n=1 Tax=Actinocorallia sp. B10E7 TaxID=3153558 RepID=UPI00325E71FD
MCGPGCGYGPAGQASEPVEVPIACTLPAGEMKARLGEFEQLFAQALTGWRREPLVLRLELRGGVEERARALLAAEAECCAFLGFEVEGGQEGLLVTVTAPPEAGAALDGLQELAEGRASAAQVAAGWPR